MADIELRIQRLEQLFDSLDPAPFHAKALDRNAEAYLRESAGEHGPREPLNIVIHAPLALAGRLDDMASAIHTHFSLAHQQAERQHRRQRRIGRIALAGGGVTLVAALLLRRWVASIGGSLGEVLAEGLLILAWVALWRPIETIGFDSWKSREERRLLMALSHVRLRFVATASATSQEHEPASPHGKDG
jgi:hypothetical protein